MSKKVATREAYGKALARIGSNNKKIVVLDADLSKSTKTAEFKEKCTDRFINMGIAEGNMMSVAAGLATCGKIAFASTFAIFAAGRAFEQIRNSICYTKLNVKICATHAGITVGEDGASHQSVEDLSLMRSIPNMTVISPSDAVETEAAIEAIAEYQGPCYVRLGRAPVNVINDVPDYKFQIGKGVVLREGTDAAIVATGIMVDAALEAHDILKDQGINVKVINIHTVKPIDKELIISAAKETGIIVTAEEHSIIGGLGSAVCEVTGEEYPVPVLRVGIKDVFGESGKPDELLKAYNLTAQDIAMQVKKGINLKSNQLLFK
ncbi:putative transketolase C-terminal section [Clostridium pasteurianum DSM 525 = ATCC 6013]|uniref:1-deoxy-D-xylulose-5-phosphate synthase n=1 Tax=Clostridium pasteurianum DSM 525 = ATCC 6013 TaxID=1262449 RepID=A0A0H3J5X4_CLOPA|nr:transketolase family protein [Clostridium pasteurianum]AJA48854.1 putative transketolase C-terminal section [Clostridium pasteurianum DSM 525 = ATCC 6013]AJA52842.1 putative transketolase C-terminal section [Clostridium pasteurianum DSM 525 = ATCC 6013]AOZ76066.1 transketolase [Clostridium pasteurianum DSM 525 = ATCC 6013]AOZ79862.1 transketolase [Clostridium pasteurianum]ELP60150.1 transketolase, central region [Clostridium pasteurianum DSM 525 = ATCC 6013]